MTLFAAPVTLYVTPGVVGDHHDTGVHPMRSGFAVERVQLQEPPCGEADLVVLQFDHQDPESKSSNVGELLRRRASWARIQAEIDKCDVRCANDHQRRTAIQFGWYRLAKPLP